MARRESLEALKAERTTNLALWLDRYLSKFEQQSVREHHATTLGLIRVSDGYASAFKRRENALRAFQGDYCGSETRLYDIEFVGRAVIAIGAASVRETSLSLLRPWGLPYIPGSALKGLCSHMAREAGGLWSRPVEPGKKAGELQRALFGDVTSAGSIVFHDAWWQPNGDTCPVDADTMTVHHAEYYQGRTPPADWDEPNPVSFLTMRGVYLCALTGPSEALDVVESLLRRALQERGLGAKTAAGYGRAMLARGPIAQTGKITWFRNNRVGLKLDNGQKFVVPLRADVFAGFVQLNGRFLTANTAVKVTTRNQQVLRVERA